MPLTTRELRARVVTRFARRSGQGGYPAFRVLHEVGVENLTTNRERLNHWRASRGFPLIEVDPEFDDTSEHARRWLDRAVADRRIDCVAVGCWRSTGYAVHGLELKVSRADWLKELRDPAKAASAARYCDHWWVAVGDASIVKPGELPDGWGLLTPSGRGLRQAVKPAKLDRVLDPRFTAALVAVSSVQHNACRGVGWVEGYNAAMTARRGRNGW